ncbi:MAG: DUF4383 domain-containing protein [Xenococcaceae cyanobacterium]
METTNFSKVYMAERYCALSLGVIFLLLGLAGFIPAFVSLPETNASFVPPDLATSSYSLGFGYLFGLFPTNFLHNILHCIVGLLGIASYTSYSGSHFYNKLFAISYIAIVLLGLFPFSNTFFGFMPLFGNNVWLNALTAIAATYFGIILPAKASNSGAIGSMQ